MVFKKLECIVDGHIEHVCNISGALCFCIDQFYIEHFISITAAIAGVAAQIDIAQELHLNVFKTIARALRAAHTGVKTECAGGIAALFGFGVLCKQRTDRVECTGVTDRV